MNQRGMGLLAILLVYPLLDTIASQYVKAVSLPLAITTDDDLVILEVSSGCQMDEYGCNKVLSQSGSEDLLKTNVDESSRHSRIVPQIDVDDEDGDDNTDDVDDNDDEEFSGSSILTAERAHDSRHQRNKPFHTYRLDETVLLNMNSATTKKSPHRSSTSQTLGPQDREHGVWTKQGGQKTTMSAEVTFKTFRGTTAGDIGKFGERTRSPTTAVASDDNAKALSARHRTISQTSSSSSISPRGFAGNLESGSKRRPISGRTGEVGTQANSTSYVADDRISSSTTLGMNIGLIIGIATGVIVLLLVFLYFVFKRRRSREEGTYKLDANDGYDPSNGGSERRSSSYNRSLALAVKSANSTGAAALVHMSKVKNKKQVREWYV